MWSPVRNSQSRENPSGYTLIKGGSQKGARGLILCPKRKVINPPLDLICV